MVADLAGRTLGRYQIGSLLGAGGMGSVYRARDTELKRDVAVKVLADAAAGDPHRLERFHREIRTVARLDHPNILEIHDFGQADGVAYAVMELLKGRDLRKLIRRRLLPVDQALDIGIAVAEGLGAAHHQGVLHRDIKPENIFVTSDGTVKILDFGLARHVTRSDPHADTVSLETDLTTPGTVVGTTAYMSPEQVRGHDLDARSDIFSLGCVLYEMFSGVQPFHRSSRADTMSAILNEQPPAISETRTDLPPAVELIVGQCLNKDPEQRFDSARDVAFALGALSQSHTGQQAMVKDTVPLPKWAVRGVALGVLAVALTTIGILTSLRIKPPELPAEKRIAVMRFEAVGSDPNLEVFSAGLSETIASGLSFLERSTESFGWVVPRDSIDRDPSLLEEMRRKYDLNVAILGRLEQRDGQLDLTVRAVEPRTRRAYSSTNLRDGLGNLASFQSASVMQIAAILGAEPDDNAHDNLRRHDTNVTAAFDSFVRGAGTLALASNTDQVDEAIALLTTATTRDPTFVRARTELARAFIRQHELTSDDEWLHRGLDEAREAAAAAGDESEPYIVVGTILMDLANTEGAIQELRQAVRVAPTDAEARLQLALALQSAGHVEDALNELDRAVFLKPAFWPIHHWIAVVNLEQGRYQSAVNEFRRVVELSPEYDGGYTNLGWVHMLLGNNDLARAAFERSLAIESEQNYHAYSNLGSLYYSESRFEDAARMFEHAVEIEDGDYRLWGNLAYSYESGVDPARAEAPLRRAVELVKDRLRTDPGNAQMLCHLAGYFASLGERDNGIEALDRAVRVEINDPQVVAEIAEAFEDLGERERALEWVERALDMGVLPSWFASHPSLRELLADDRYRQLVSERMAQP